MLLRLESRLDEVGRNAQGGVQEREAKDDREEMRSRTNGVGDGRGGCMGLEPSIVVWS